MGRKESRKSLQIRSNYLFVTGKSMNILLPKYCLMQIRKCNVTGSLFLGNSLFILFTDLFIFIF